MPIIGDEEKRAVQDVLNSGIIAQGPVVQSFEEEFADYCGTQYAVAFNSGTAAIHTALHVADIGPGDVVITTPFTFIATANPILMQGATIQFVDISADTFNLNVDLLESSYSPNTKAIIAVDLFGQPAEYETINTFARDRDLCVIEDACQSVGATYRGVKTGNLADFGCFSLYATKNMMSAEGGVLTTNDENAAKRAKSFRQHGMVGPYQYEGLGYNYRTTDILASIALAQLHKIDDFNKLRNQNAERLIEGIGDIPGLILPSIKPERTSSFHQFTIRITAEYPHSREKFMESMHDEGIGTGIYYPKPLHHYDHIRKLGYSLGDFPIAEQLANEVVSLPVHPSLTADDIDKIVSTVRKISHV